MYGFKQNKLEDLCSFSLMELRHKEMLESQLQTIVTKLQRQSPCLRAEPSGSGLQPWTGFRAQVHWKQTKR